MAEIEQEQINTALNRNGTPGRMTRKELDGLLDHLMTRNKMGDRNLTMLPLQGIVLNNVVIMATEENGDEHILMWPSHELKEEEQAI